jgi:hypothetical protein
MAYSTSASNAEFKKKLEKIFPNLSGAELNDTTNRIMLTNKKPEQLDQAVYIINQRLQEVGIVDDRYKPLPNLSDEQKRQSSELFELLKKSCPNLKEKTEDIFRDLPGGLMFEFLEGMENIKENPEIIKFCGEELGEQIKNIREARKSEELKESLESARDWIEKKEKEVNKPVVTKVCNLIKSACKLVGSYLSGDSKGVEKCKKQMDIIKASIGNKSKINSKLQEVKTHVERASEREASSGLSK